MVLYCNLAKLGKNKKQYHIKLICKISEMPKNARYIDTIYQPEKAYNIYVTDSGV